jgi:uncharacterized protein (TIGR00299 family) protein
LAVNSSANAWCSRIVSTWRIERAYPKDCHSSPPTVGAGLRTITVLSVAVIDWPPNAVPARADFCSTASIAPPERTRHLMRLIFRIVALPATGFDIDSGGSMRVAVIDPFSGASGDMLLGALFDAGLDPAALESELAGLRIPGISISASATSHHGLSGTRAMVAPEEGHHARSWAEIRQLLTIAAIDDRVKQQAIAVFQNLAEAEAAVHETEVEDVHFHEVGALDTIVDIVGVVAGLRLLGVDRVYCGPVHVGGGSVTAAHGLMPVPAPATARLIARFGMPIAQPHLGEETVGELLTPTGAALLGTLATFSRPGFTVTATGSGLGGRSLPWANLCRVMIGELLDTSEEVGESPGLIVLETNIDDMNPQFTGILLDRLFAAGALDAWSTAIAMKKGRPAMTVSVIAPDSRRDVLTTAMIENSTTLGVRWYPVARETAWRRIESVETRWGPVRIKLKGWHGRVIDAAPEYDDCAAIAGEHEIAIQHVWNEAHRYGEVYVGRRYEVGGNLSVLDSGGRTNAPSADR